MSKIISDIDLEFMCGSWRYIRFGRWGGVSEEVTSWQIVGALMASVTSMSLTLKLDCPPLP